MLSKGSRQGCGAQIGSHRGYSHGAEPASLNNVFLGVYLLTGTTTSRSARENTDWPKMCREGWVPVGPTFRTPAISDHAKKIFRSMG